MFGIFRPSVTVEAVISGPRSGRSTPPEPLGKDRGKILEALAHSTKAEFDFGRDWLSASIPSATLRRLVLSDKDFRDGLRNLDASVEEIAVHRRGGVDRLVFQSSREYVSYVKSHGVRSQWKFPFADSIEQLKATLEDWGNFKMPAAILLLVCGFVIGAASLGLNKAIRMVQDHAQETEEMLKSEQGLEAAVRRRAGLPATTQPAKASSSNTTVPNSAVSP